MNSYAFSVSLEFLLQKFIIDGFKSEVDTTSNFIRGIVSDSIYINKNLDTLELEDINKIFTMEVRYIEIEKRLERPKYERSLENIIALYLLEKKIEKEIKGEELKGGYVSFVYEEERYKIFVGDVDLSPRGEKKKDKPWLDYNNLILCRDLLNGYTYKEEKGSHFLVTTPNKFIHAVTLSSCTCNTFLLEQDCSHYRSVQAIMNYRHSI